MSRVKVVYVISDINKALAFEWISQEIDRSRFELHFLLLNSGSSHLETFLKANGIPVTRISCSGKKDWPLAWIKVLGYLLRHKPHAVHCHLIAASIIGLSAAKAALIPKRLYTRHHSDYHFRYFPKGVKWDRLCNRLATKIVAPSAAVQYVLTEREKVHKEKVVIIHHGFDLRYFEQVPEMLHQQLRSKYNPNQQYPVIGVISRFTELKGIQYIIPAFRNLLKEYPDALLLLFNAKGDYYTQLDAQLQAELPIGSYRKVEFENELAAVYSIFDAFVQVSTDITIEAFGQTYIEALASKVPSVFTLSGIASDFIKDGENALVVPFKDSNAILVSLRRILNDKDLTAKLKSNGSDSVHQLFSLNKMIQRLEQLY